MYICFNLADRHPPKLVHCPADIYAVAGEKISWAIPKATDNVGIRDLWLEPNVHNGSQIGSGNHVFRYVAEDWHGNKAECRFIVSVIGSGTYVVFFCIIMLIFKTRIRYHYDDITKRFVNAIYTGNLREKPYSSRPNFLIVILE